jgi:hypothetical protein
MYRRKINNTCNDIIGAAEMYKFLYDEFNQVDTLKFYEYINSKIAILVDIEFKIKSRRYNTDAIKPTSKNKL